jgi:hypothetical protein
LLYKIIFISVSKNVIYSFSRYDRYTFFCRKALLLTVYSTLNGFV